MTDGKKTARKNKAQQYERKAFLKDMQHLKIKVDEFAVGNDQHLYQQEG